MNYSRLRVERITTEKAMRLVERHHYSRRRVGAKECFGVFQGVDLVGCVVYSQPASYTLCKGVCGPEYKGHVIELARLVLVTDESNAASQAIARSLNLLGDQVIVSYADCNDHVGHVGYVYQATNWLYTGQGSAEPVWIDPRDDSIISFTRRHIDDKAKAAGLDDWRQLKKQPQKGKYRYVTFTGSKAFRKSARLALKYPVLPYPKGPTRRHEPVEVVGELF
jgi:hypothetical protein